MTQGESGIDQEVRRYREMLEPLLELGGEGLREVPAEERRALDPAMLTVRGYHGDHLDLEEAVAAFARALWAAPGAGEPRAWIAIALLARARQLPDAPRAALVALARGFAERAFALEPGQIACRTAWARSQMLHGELGEAERIAGFLPEQDPLGLALRSEVAEKRGDVEAAIRFREAQLGLEKDPAAFRVARNKLGLLLQAAGRIDESIEVHQANLARHPDYAWGRVNLAAALEQKGETLEAYGELESALVLGLEEARPFLEELGARIDREALGRFRGLLRRSRDGDRVDLTPPAGAAQEAR